MGFIRISTELFANLNLTVAMENAHGHFFRKSSAFMGHFLLKLKNIMWKLYDSGVLMHDVDVFFFRGI
jgi:hypothetical protein